MRRISSSPYGRPTGTARCRNRSAWVASPRQPRRRRRRRQWTATASKARRSRKEGKGQETSGEVKDKARDVKDDVEDALDRDEDDECGGKRGRGGAGPARGRPARSPESDRGDERRKEAVPPRGVKKGQQARPSVRAHQGFARGARPLGGDRRGDRGPDREQGARASRRGARVVAALTRGHLLREARRYPLAPQGTARPHARPALRGGEGEGHRGSLEDEQGRACAGRGDPQLTEADGRALLGVPVRRRRPTPAPSIEGSAIVSVERGGRFRATAVRVGRRRAAMRRRDSDYEAIRESSASSGWRRSSGGPVR